MLTSSSSRTIQSPLSFSTSSTNVHQNSRTMSAFVPFTPLSLSSYQTANGTSIQHSANRKPLKRLSSTSPMRPCPLHSFTKINVEQQQERRQYVQHPHHDEISAVSQLPRMSVTTKAIARVSSSRSVEWRGERPTRQVQVLIDRPRRNQRIITATNLIDAPLLTVWNLLSDYNRLSDHIPNLVVSKRCPHPKPDGIRLEQCGAQSILGFQFRASLTMDMVEHVNDVDGERCILFDLVSSTDFKEFCGVWQMKNVDQGRKTQLFYSVAIVPKGIVPVSAIEWRISEDVPQNMDAVRLECERRRRINVAKTSQSH